MFGMAQRLGEDVCYRCDKRIELVEDLSVEHKEPWQSSTNPVVSFFDLDNIAFSHLSCNSAAGSGGRVRANVTRLSPELRKAKSREQWELNKNDEGYKAYHRDYMRNRYATDPVFRAYFLEKGRKKAS